MSFTLNILLVAMVQGAMAFGQTQPVGPHDGFVRTAANFRTEVLALGAGRIKVYLLDESLKNPVVQQSSVSAWIHRGSARKPFACKPEPDHFICELTLGSKMKVGDSLRLKTERLGTQGKLVVYKLPLTVGTP